MKLLIYVAGIITGFLLQKFGLKWDFYLKTLVSNAALKDFLGMCSGFGAIIAIFFAVFTYNQSERFFRIENRPIPKIVIPQIQNAEISSQEFQIQLYNKGRRPITDVKIYWKIFLDKDNNSECIEEKRAIFPIIEQNEYEQVTTNFKYTNLNEHGFLFIIIGIKSKDLLDKDIYQTIFYCSLAEKKWWKVDDKLYPTLDKKHQKILKQALQDIRRELNKQTLM